MAPSTVRALVDKLLGGELDQWLLERRDAGDSYNEIAFRLRAERDVSVTGETIRSWVADAKANIEATA